MESEGERARERGFSAYFSGANEQKGAQQRRWDASPPRCRPAAAAEAEAHTCRTGRRRWRVQPVALATSDERGSIETSPTRPAAPTETPVEPLVTEGSMVTADAAGDLAVLDVDAEGGTG